MRKFFRYAIFENRWLWAHMLLGLTAAKILSTSVSDRWVVIAILAGALVWEAGEWLFTDIKEIYGSVEIFLMDSTGDILGAMLMVTIFLL
ncbi:MAG: hypothetical protein D6748_02720 [Calditrichaeota bacterium]|nr:MAG: hypothetical protein D6748_02720 [Calditrichota bacterium]